jgi:hypothetical protein
MLTKEYSARAWLGMKKQNAIINLQSLMASLNLRPK